MNAGWLKKFNCIKGREDIIYSKLQGDDIIEAMLASTRRTTWEALLGSNGNGPKSSGPMWMFLVVFVIGVISTISTEQRMVEFVRQIAEK
jgi:hypothetical protein